MSDSCIRTLCNCLSNLPYMRGLNLSENDITPIGFNSMIESSRNLINQLEILKVKDNQINRNEEIIRKRLMEINPELILSI